MTFRSARVSRGTVGQAARLLLLSVSKAAGGVFIIALNILLVQFLPVEDFGRYAFCITAILLADAVFGGPFDLAVVKLCGEAGGKAEGRSIDAARAGLHLKLVVMPLIGLLATLAFQASVLRDGDARLLIATGCAVLSLLLLRSVLVILQVTGRIAAYAATEGMQLGLRIGLVALVLGFFSPRGDLILWALAVGSLAAALAGGILFAPGLLRLSGFRSLPHASIAGAAGWFFATIALGAVIGRLDVMILGWSGMTVELGLFSAGRIISAIPELLGSYLAVFLTPRLVSAMRDGTMRKLHDSLQPVLFAAAFASMVLALLIWPAISRLILPPDYSVSGTIVLILLPGSLAALATVPLALPVVMIRRSRALLLFDAVLFPIALTAYSLVVLEHRAMGVAVVSSATMLLRSGYVLFLAFRITRTSSTEETAPAIG